MAKKIAKLTAGILGATLAVSGCAVGSGCGKKQEEDAGNAVYLMGSLSTDEGQMMGIVVQTKTKTIVIDGGAKNHADQLVTFLKEKADSHVDAWFFTHPHQDHLGAFFQIFNEFSIYEDVQVDKIYHHFPTVEELDEYGYRNADENSMQHYAYKLFEGEFSDRVHVLQKDEKFVFDDVTLTVLRVFNSEIKTNFVNNSSAVFRIENENASFLILGDLGVQGGEEVMENCPLELLQTDYTQMAHHGQGGVSQEFYQYIQPRKCIWPTPEWLWRNDGGGGFDTGNWQTVRTREWMEQLGVTKHYVAKDGTQKIPF